MRQFDEMGLDSRILQGIKEMGFEEPSAIQEKVIPEYLENPSDLVGLAQTGTGKTAAFGLPILQTIDPELRKPQALILSPTRELCVQIARELNSYSKFLPEISVTPIYGGADIYPQVQALRKGTHIITATPGRMHDMVRKGKVDLSQVRIMVLDEADEMLNMGFQEDVDAILDTTPDSKNTLLFSATMPKGVAAIAGKYMSNPTEITVGRKNSGSENIAHDYYMVHAKDRYGALKRVMDITPEIYGIVFCRTRQETKDVAANLIQDGYSAEALHGDLSQQQRDYVMGKFRTQGVQMLVATDVAARGIDVNNLTHVINYNLPEDVENYTHRSGRTGRAGRSGVSISIIHMKEKGKIRMIEKIIGQKFNRKQIPGGKEICEKQLLHLTDRLHKVKVNEADVEQFLPSVLEKLEDLSREEIIKQFVSLEFNRFLDYYRDAPDLNVKERKNERGEKRGDVDWASGKKMTALRLNVGSSKGILPKDIIGLVVQATGNKRVEVGRISLQSRHAVVEVESDFASAMQQNCRKLTFSGIPLVVDVLADQKFPRARKPYSGGRSQGGFQGGGRSRSRSQNGGNRSYRK